MLRNDLLENGYHFETIEPKKTTINLLWAGFALVLTAPVLLLYFMIINGDLQDISLPYIEFSATALNILFIGTPVIYFILKAVLTVLLSPGRSNNIDAKLAADTGIPILVGRDAFKTRQIIIIYLMPLIITYPLLILTGIISGGDINVLVLILIMTYFMSSDLLLVMYVLFLKVRYNAEYIAVKNHVYMLTLYSSTYIKRKNHSDRIKNKLHEFKKSIKDSIPQIKARVILIPLITAGLLFISINYIFANKEKFMEINPDDFETYLEYCNNMQPTINKYTGDIFSDMYHETGDYTGCEILAGHNLIYCNDNGSVIYYDSEKDSVMRLNDGDKPERLCIYEDCRNNPGEMCGHMPDFVSNGCYSEGVLYGAQSYSYADEKYGELLKCYIIRYDIYKNKMDKLIEFEMGDENGYIHNIFICYNYLYAVVSADNMSDLTVTRIDLSNEEACIVYSDEKDAKNKDKIERLIYSKIGIFSSFSGILYGCGADMASFTPLSSFGYGETKYFETHGDNIYYLANSGLYGCIYDIKKINKKTYQTKLLFDYEAKKMPDYDSQLSITEFCIDGDFLYYTLIETRTFKYANGVISHYETHKDGIIYRVKLDIDLEVYQVDFRTKFAVYTPKQGYSLSKWNVKDDYMYLLFDSDNGDKTLRRIKINSSSDPYVFW